MNYTDVVQAIISARKSQVKNPDNYSSIGDEINAPELLSELTADWHFEKKDCVSCGNDASRQKILWQENQPRAFIVGLCAGCDLITDKISAPVTNFWAAIQYAKFDDVHSYAMPPWETPNTPVHYQFSTFRGKVGPYYIDGRCCICVGGGPGEVMRVPMYLIDKDTDDSSYDHPMICSVMVCKWCAIMIAGLTGGAAYTDYTSNWFETLREIPRPTEFECRLARVYAEKCVVASAMEGVPPEIARIIAEILARVLA